MLRGQSKLILSVQKNEHGPVCDATLMSHQPQHG